VTKVRRSAKPETTADHLARYQRAYERDNNPLMAWRALVEALASDVSLPPFVLDYLDGVGWDLLEMAARARTDKSAMTDAKITAALGLKRRGRGIIAAREHIASRNRLIAQFVEHQLAEAHQLDHTYDHVARLFNVGRKTVRDAWEAHSRRQ
jgi:hypothetical protein